MKAMEAFGMATGCLRGDMSDLVRIIEARFRVDSVEYLNFRSFLRNPPRLPPLLLVFGSRDDQASELS